MDEEEEKRLREKMLDSDSSSSNSDSSKTSSSEDESGSNRKKSGEHSSDDDSIQDLTNKSIDSGPSELQEVVDTNNYLPYISEKYESKTDILEEIDRNERSFKIIAEKMI